MTKTNTNTNQPTDFASLFIKGVERAAELQKKSLDDAARQNAEAIAVCKKAPQALRAVPGVFDLAGQAFEGYIEAQKSVIDHIVQQTAALVESAKDSTTLIPSIATWLSGELGLRQTHNSCDIVAACAGMSYGLAEAVRLLQEVKRPVIIVCAEKFSDKIGTVRTSRMIFGDGATAMVVGPAPAGAASDIEVFQTYASGPWSEVNSIIWPNPEFDNNITVYGPEVKILAKRYLEQMIGELKALPHPDGEGTLMDAIDLVVPHQANKNMVLDLAQAAGVAADHLLRQH